MAVTTARRPGVRPRRRGDVLVLRVPSGHPPVRTGVPRAVPLIAAVAALVATAWSWHAGSLALYGDARAHMNVARHVTDGITPGLAQLGSVWLPLPHILLIPLVAVGPLWHSALAGAIVGGACFVYSAVRMFSLGEEWLGNRRCAWVAFAVYVTNVNLLYVQGTALTEPVLLAFFIGATYHLARWTRTLKHRELVIAAAMIMCATLTRYDGWFLLIAGFAVVAAWSRVNERRANATEASLVMFTAIGGFGIALWVLYNLIIFHDPLFFIHSSFSAQSQQTALQHVGALNTKGALGESGLTYGWAVFDVAGGAAVGLGIFGLLDILVIGGTRRARDLAIVCVLAAPLVFNVIALWAGQSTIRVPERAPFGMWNVRYGLMTLPLLALGAAALVRGSSGLSHRTVLAVAASGCVLMATSTPITLADGRIGTSSAAAGRPEQAAGYLARHYRGGRILADEAASAPLIYASGLDLSEFVTIGSHPYYERAMSEPVKNVEWVVAYDGDAIADDMSAHADRFRGFSPILRQGRVRLLRRIPPGAVPGIGGSR